MWFLFVNFFSLINFLSISTLVLTIRWSLPMMPILCNCYTSIPPPSSQRTNKQSNTKQTIPKQAKTAARTTTKINSAPNETTNIEEVEDGDGNGNHDEREHITKALSGLLAGCVSYAYDLVQNKTKKKTMRFGVWLGRC